MVFMTRLPFSGSIRNHRSVKGMQAYDQARRMMLCSALVVIAAATPAALAQGTKPAAAETQPAALPAPLSGFHDEGAFGLYVNEERLAAIEFRWQPDGAYEGTCELSMANQTVTTSVQITVDADGRWTKVDYDTPLGPINIVREGAEVRKTFKDETETIELKPDALLFENFSPALLATAVRAYDEKAGGEQTFPTFILPGLMEEATVSLKDRVERSINERDLEFARYVYTIVGIEITLWVDADGRIVLGEVPSQHAAYVRDGYEILRKAPLADPLLSRPEHEITVDRDVGVPMRDEVKLATDIYRPDAEGKYPIILVRTPYKKEMAELQGRYYARRGYVVAVQDCRGRFGSEGTWEPFIHEPHDGHDSIEWLARQPWSNGKVGMFGGSYVGWVQWWAARERPPHLVTIVPNVSPPDPFYNIPYEYGVFFLTGAIWWADILETEATADLSGAAFSEIADKKYHKLLRALPVIDLDKAVLGKENPYWRTWIRHPTNDDYWEQANFLDHLGNVNIPVFHQTGWFDGDGIGTKLNYLRMVSCGHAHQKLVIGPWGHTSEAQRRVGERDFGPQAIVDMQTAYLRWFDYWLKDIPNGIADEPLVGIFVMGSNEWLHGDVYPLPQTKFEKWYLASDGQANTSQGDGRLVRESPPADAPVDRYTYDPGDPTPDPDFYEEPEEEKADQKAYHEKIAGSRKDILVYVTEPFDEPYTFAGPISGVLYAASSARDTDWFVRLMEVDDEGEIFPLVAGKLRARFRNSTKTPEKLKPGEVYEYHLDMWQTGITIPEGHRLRVEVASASFPLFSRNLNTGGHNEMETEYVAAEQTIYHDAQHPSYVLLPAIPDVETGQD
jgi:putative CocE/NonD family hydrolase